MGNGFQFLDIILFAAIAGFFVLRLRSVLGKRTGHEKPPQDPFSRRRGESDSEGDDKKVIPLPDRTSHDEASPDEEGPLPDVEAPAGAPVSDRMAKGDAATGLTQIKLADKTFDQEVFLGGARAAFEMVVSAFAQGDTKALRPLLSNDVYTDFAGAIEERQKAEHTLETTLVGITGADIIEADLQGRTAFITVKFVSEQVNVMRDSENRIVEGDPSQVATITDIWTFGRNTRSRDPNWTLVATQSPN